jgi:hypothetical protein
MAVLVVPVQALDRIRIHQPIPSRKHSIRDVKVDVLHVCHGGSHVETQHPQSNHDPPPHGMNVRARCTCGLTGRTRRLGP